MNCPNCGKEIREEDALFCPYCALPLKLMKKRSGFPTAAGVLAILSASFCMVWAIPALINAINYFGSRWYSSSYSIFMLISGLFSIVAFALGLAAGIATLKRQRFPLAVAGQSVVLASSIVIGFFMPYGFGWILGVPLLVLSIISVVFTAISKKEFT